VAAGAAAIVLPTQLLAGNNVTEIPSLKDKKVLFIWGA